HTVMSVRHQGRQDLHRAGTVHAQAPLRDVVMMRPHVGMSAAGVFAVITPRGEMLVDPARAEDRIAGPHRRGAEPEVPVQAGLQPDRTVSSDRPLTRGDRPFRIRSLLWQPRHRMSDGVRPLPNHLVRGVDNSYSWVYRP